MATERGLVDHADVVKAVAFCTGIPAATVAGYVVIVLMTDDDYKITANCTTKAATTALVANALAELAMSVAEDLNGVLLA